MALSDTCLLALNRESLSSIKKALYDQGLTEDFVKLEVLLRGNFLVKKQWRAQLVEELAGQQENVQRANTY